MSAQKPIRQLFTETSIGAGLALMTISSGTAFGVVYFGLGSTLLLLIPSAFGKERNYVFQVLSYGCIMGGFIQGVLLFHVLATQAYITDWSKEKGKLPEIMYRIRRPMVHSVVWGRDQKFGSPHIFASWVIVSLLWVGIIVYRFFINPIFP